SSHFPGYFPLLLTRASELDKMKAIFSKLSYGIVCFSSTGEILSISSAILDSLKLDSSSLSIQTFSKIIPPHFYNDVIWGLALETTEGIFENYRVRIKLPNDSGQSILFNISGYRSHDSTIQSLWQVVFLDPKSVDSLTEGSILNEARIHNITRNYVPQLVEQKARDVVRLGGKELTNEECYITVLFCDIVNFTAYVENNEKEESVIHTLNLVLGRISRTVNQFEGSIDKFMGDCVMVLFKNPLNAVLAALEIQKHSLDINSLRKNAGKEMLLLRIGIHWGQVIIGNIGISGRLDWTTIGDVVNTASRLEKNCQPGAVLISQILYEVIATVEQPGIKFGDIFNIKLKGKRKELTVRYVHSDDH
ncbi:MAG TPA: adenylate/guanylate cyclase domain-containing protein, partial [Nitrosomonas sp.]|nr:adenylate/guanylate cyclase domain-containing protein [Nitrosomonas sp.]